MSCLLLVPFQVPYTDPSYARSLIGNYWTLGPCSECEGLRYFGGPCNGIRILGEKGPIFEDPRPASSAWGPCRASDQWAPILQRVTFMFLVLGCTFFHGLNFRCFKYFVKNCALSYSLLIKTLQPPHKWGCTGGS